ncbi:MAG: Lacal_2735 family protein [Hahellaceae bacterium]|jgi:hypothetical protein|nr:Lacal_2735 family protein [Hahellaceae bacterium]MCP5210435.1 Lacal_2735 family protein [Hahellaceae bacterium]
MFGFLKRDSQKKLKEQYEKRLHEAFLAQRNGNIRLYSELTAQAEAIRIQLTDTN